MKTEDLNLLQERIQYYENLISPIFPRSFPEGFKLCSTDWILTHETVMRPPIRVNIDGVESMIRPLGTLDVELLNDKYVIAKPRNGHPDSVEILF